MLHAQRGIKLEEQHLQFKNDLMDKKWEDIIKILAEDIRETKQLTKEISELVVEARRSADAAVQKADAAWELVVITTTAAARNEIDRPWYKKLLGLS